MVNIGNEWDALLSDEFKKDYYLKLRQFLISEYNSRRIFPPMNDIFNALRYTSYSDVKAVIIGNYRSGPVSRDRSGTRAVLFGKKGSRAAALAREHL